MAVLALFATACGDDESSSADIDGASFNASFGAFGTYDIAAENAKGPFEEATGARVELIAEPFEVLVQSAVTDLATGTGALDVITGEAWIGAVWDRMRPLNDFIDRDEYGQDAIVGLWEKAPRFDGKQIGVPFTAEAYSVLYRTDLFEAAGVEADWTTWDEFMAALATVESTLPDDVVPLVYSWGASDQLPGIFFGMYDGYHINSDGRWAVDPPLAEAAIDQLVELRQFSSSEASAYGINEASAVFTNGGAATIIGWTSFLREGAYNESSPVFGKWSASTFPGPGFPFLSSWNFFISGQTDDEKADAAWEWIKFYNDPKRAKQNFIDFNFQAPFAGFFEDEELLADYANDLPFQKENLERAAAPAMTLPAYLEWSRIMGEVLLGNLTSAQAVAEMNEAFADELIPTPLIQKAQVDGTFQR